MSRGTIEDQLAGVNGEWEFLQSGAIDGTDRTITVPAGAQLALQADVDFYGAFDTTAGAAQGFWVPSKTTSPPAHYVMVKFSATGAARVLHYTQDATAGTLKVFILR